MNGSFPMNVYVDPDTGAFLRAVIDPGESNEQVINIHSYTTIDATHKMIGSWSIGDDKGAYSYTKVTLNPNVGNPQLHPPTPVATWTFANSNPIPIKVTQDRIYVDATVNGVKGRFMIDTGDSSITLTDEFANRAGVKTVTSSTTEGIGGQERTLVRKVDAFTIGGNTLSNLYVDTINRKFEDKDVGEKLDGFIGFDLFGGAVVSLTLSKQQMTIADPQTANVDPNSGIRVIPDLTDGIPHVPVKINGKVDAMALLDSGGNDLVIISKLVERRGITLVADHSNTFLGGNTTIQGVGGTESVLCGLLGNINIGPITYGDIEACESAHMALNEANIGFDFMKNFDFVFDYPHGQMILTPHKN